MDRLERLHAQIIEVELNKHEGPKSSGDKLGVDDGPTKIVFNPNDPSRLSTSTLIVFQMRKTATYFDIPEFT